MVVPATDDESDKLGIPKEGTGICGTTCGELTGLVAEITTRGLDRAKGLDGTANADAAVVVLEDLVGVGGRNIMLPLFLLIVVGRA